MYVVNIILRYGQARVVLKLKFNCLSIHGDNADTKLHQYLILRVFKTINLKLIKQSKLARFTLHLLETYLKKCQSFRYKEQPLLDFLYASM